MNIEFLNKLKLIENDHELNILVMDYNLIIPISELLELKNYGNVTISTSTPLLVSQLLGKVQGLGFNVVLTSRIPIRQYDVLISNNISNIVKLVIDKLKIKYLLFLNSIGQFNLSNYSEIADKCYKLTSQTDNKSDLIDNENNQIDNSLLGKPITPFDDNQYVSNDLPCDTNDASNYEIFLKNIATTPLKYDKYRINYLKPIVPGKVSIIMIVSNLNNNFAEVLRDIRSQNVSLIEYIIIDNAAGFRNNVKPNIRYGDKMPIDFCLYHAKELANGEYIICLNETSENINVMETILQGKYETR